MSINSGTNQTEKNILYRSLAISSVFASYIYTWLFNICNMIRSVLMVSCVWVYFLLFVNSLRHLRSCVSSAFWCAFILCMSNLKLPDYFPFSILTNDSLGFVHIYIWFYFPQFYFSICDMNVVVMSLKLVYY